MTHSIVWPGGDGFNMIVQLAGEEKWDLRCLLVRDREMHVYRMDRFLATVDRPST